MYVHYIYIYIYIGGPEAAPTRAWTPPIRWLRAGKFKAVARTRKRSGGLNLGELHGHTKKAGRSKKPS